MQCVRCGRVLNVEERRCPNCLASLSNERISQMEVAKQVLTEAADIERSNMWNRQTRRAISSGAGVPLLLILTLNVPLLVVGMVIGAATGWFVAWRHWGHNRATLLYTAAMALPTLALAGFNPFTILLVICIGALLGIAIDSAMGL